MCIESYDLSFLIITANCRHPELLELLSTSSNESVPIVEVSDYTTPVEGTTVTFSCPSGLALIGSHSATCTGNGEWKPDPRLLMCIGE